LSVDNVPVAIPVGKKGWPEWIFRKGQWVHTHNWTEEERDFLRREYKNTIESQKELALEMGVTVPSIRGQLARIGILRLCVWYSKEDQRFLEENYSKLPPEVIARRLHKSINSVTKKACRLGLSNRIRDGWFNLEDVSKILGVTTGWVKRRMDHGFELKIKPYHPDKQPKKGEFTPWYISEKSLRDFIRRYPEELQGRNVDMVMIVDILVGVKSPTTR